MAVSISASHLHCQLQERVLPMHAPVPPVCVLVRHAEHVKFSAAAKMYSSPICRASLAPLTKVYASAAGSASPAPAPAKPSASPAAAPAPAKGKDTPIEWSLQKAPYKEFTVSVGDTVRKKVHAFSRPMACWQTSYSSLSHN